MKKYNVLPGTASDGDPAETPLLHAIQPHGCLIVFDGALSEVVQISANCMDFLGHSVAASLKKTGAELLGTSVADRVQAALVDEERLGGAMMINMTVREAKKSYHLDAYRAPGRIIVEIEYASGKIGPRLLSALNQCLAEVTSADSEDRLFQSLVEGFQTLAGCDQVYLVQFQDDDSALVVAESDRDPTRSFLGGRFGPQDFAKPMRDRLRRNPLRSLPDLNTEPVPLLPRGHEEGNGEDLIPGMLQATTPEAARYIQGLGAGDFLGAALISDAALWGMVVGHHTKQAKKSPARRNAARALVQAATQRLFLLQAREHMTFLQKVDDSRVSLSEELDADFGSLLTQYGNEWMAVFKADGVGLVQGRNVHLLGATVPEADVLSLTKSLPPRMGRRSTWKTNALTSVDGLEMAPSTQVSGVLAAALPSTDKSAWIILFRHERIETRFWLTPNAEEGGEGADPPVGTIRGVPVRRQRILGQSTPWGPQECAAIRDIAEDLSVAAAAREIHDLNERLETRANTDPLTDTHNRRSMESILYREVEVAGRHGTPVSALLLDIDHFKRVNDTYGHEVGDAALVEVAKCIGSHLRISDQLARWGGEEFLVLAPQTNAEQAQVLAKRICEAVATLCIEVVGSVTTSIGVAEWQRGQNTAELISTADKAMYEAKDHGRNQVIVSSEFRNIA